MSMFSQLLSRTQRPFCAAGYTPKLHLSSSGTWTQSGESRTERLASGSAFPPCSAHKGPEDLHAGPRAGGWLLRHVAGRQSTVSSCFLQPALEIFTRNTSAFLLGATDVPWVLVSTALLWFDVLRPRPASTPGLSSH